MYFIQNTCSTFRWSQCLIWRSYAGVSVQCCIKSCLFFCWHSQFKWRVSIAFSDDHKDPCFSSFSKLLQLPVEMKLSVEFFFSAMGFWLFGSKYRQFFVARHCKILCHASFCVGVLHVQQPLIIHGQLHTVGVCMRFRNLRAGAVWADSILKPVQLCVLSVASCGFPSRGWGSLRAVWLICLPLSPR